MNELIEDLKQTCFQVLNRRKLTGCFIAFAPGMSVMSRATRSLKRETGYMISVSCYQGMDER